MESLKRNKYTSFSLKKKLKKKRDSKKITSSDDIFKAVTLKHCVVEKSKNF